jgi:hypothetical protein
MPASAKVDADRRAGTTGLDALRHPDTDGRGDKSGAADMFRQAGELAQAAEARYELACGLTGLASTLADDDPTAARRHLRRALVMFREMNVPDQFAVEKRLAELGGIEGTAGS